MASAILTTTATTGVDAQAEPQDPTFEVTPSTNLGRGVQATVSGRGLEPGQTFGVAQCIPNPTTFEDCDPFNLQPFSAEDDGTFNAPIILRSTIRTRNGEDRDCAESPCVVTLFGDDEAPLGDRAITFDPNAPDGPIENFTVNPTTDLVDRQVLTARVEQSNRMPDISFRQCRSGSDCRNQTGFSGVITRGFGFGLQTFQVTVRRFLVDGFDCASAAEACVLEVEDFASEQSLQVPLSFDPAVEVPMLEFALDANTNLPATATVVARGDVWPAGTFISAQQCAGSIDSNNSGDFIRCRQAGSDRITADGSFVLELDLRRFIRRSSQIDDLIDCATEADCVVIVTANDQRDSAQSPTLSFDATTPRPPIPEIVVSPNVGLVDGDRIEIAGTNVDAEGVGVLLCPASVPTTNAFDMVFRCALTTSLAEVTVEDGIFLLTIEVFARTETGSSQAIDCEAGGCDLVVFTDPTTNNEQLFRSPIQFGETPPLTMTVSPSTGLAQEERVTVVVEGFTLPTLVAITQCESAASTTAGCAIPPGDTLFTESDDQGRVEVEIPLRSTFASGMAGGSVDCTAPEATCVVSAFAALQTDPLVSTPVQFADQAPTAPAGEDLVLLPGVGFTTEGDIGGGQIPARLNEAVDYQVTMNYRLIGFRSDAANDFDDMTGTVTFAPGQTEAMVTVGIIDDELAEENEAVLIGFEAAADTPGTVEIGGFGFGGLVIFDNDNQPQ